MRLTVLAASLIAILLVVASQSSSPGPTLATFPGANGRIAYMDFCPPVEQFSSPTIDIFSAQPDGSDIQRLTSDSANDLSPAWSPDGSQIAFVREREPAVRDVWLMNADGSNQRQVTNLGFADAPEWSPDGERLLLLGSGPVGLDIFAMDLDGSDIINLTNLSGPDTVAGAPSWSPDGTKIAFQRSTMVTPPDIFLVDPDGSNQERIIDSPDWESNPDWAPDGSLIVFTRQQTDPPVPFQLYSMRPDGSDQQRVTDQFIDHARWSPDGTKIIFQTAHNAVTGFGTFTMNADGTNVEQFLPQNTGFGPVWQPLPPGARPVDSIVPDCATPASPSPQPTPSPAPTAAVGGGPVALPRTGGPPESPSPVGWPVLVVPALALVAVKAWLRLFPRA